MAAGGLGVATAGATISTVGLRVLDGPSVAANTETNAPAMTVHNPASSFSGSVATVLVTREASVDFKLTEGISSGVSVQNLNGAGVWTSKGGLVATTSGWTISAGGLHSYDGTTIHTSGLQIPVAGATVTAGGLKIPEDGSSIASTADAADALTVSASSDSFSQAGLHLTTDTTTSLGSVLMLEASSGSPLTQRFTIDGGGDVVFSSSTPTSAVSGSGATISTSGGLASAGNLYVGGIVAVLSDTEQSTSSITGSCVVKGGLGVADDLYIGGVLVVENSNLEYNTISGDTEIVRSTDDASAFPTLNLKRSRTGTSSIAPVHSNDLLGKITINGYDGDSYESAAQIRVHVENSGAPVANNNMGGKMTFATTATAANTLVSFVMGSVA